MYYLYLFSDLLFLSLSLCRACSGTVNNTPLPVSHKPQEFTILSAVSAARMLIKPFPGLPRDLRPCLGFTTNIPRCDGLNLINVYGTVTFKLMHQIHVQNTTNNLHLGVTPQVLFVNGY